MTDTSGSFAAVAADPQPVYRAMRQSDEPITKVDGALGAMAIVWHRRHIEEAFRRPADFVSTESVDLQNVRPLIPLNIDPPDHKKYRRILEPLFAPRVVSALERPVADLANRLIDAWGDSEEIEFTSAFSVPLPSQVFLTLIGLPLEELPRLLAMKDGIIRPHYALGLTVGHPDAVAHQKRTAASIYEYFESVLDERAALPRGDFFSRLSDLEMEGRRLTRQEILDMAFLLLIAGLDTVTAALDCLFAFLAAHPAHRAELVGDPSTIPVAVEELLRWETPVMAVTRRAARDTSLGGCPIEAGRVVTLMLGSGNTDEIEFADGDEVRFDRHPNRHLAFGGGIHRCLGSHLARLELRVALGEWHRRIPDYRVRPGAELKYTAGIRSVAEFPMVLR